MATDGIKRGAQGGLQSPTFIKITTERWAYQTNLALPGSWVPLALILGIFMKKYVVGFMTAMQPSLAQDANFAVPIAALYCAFSGVFLAGSIRSWRLFFQVGKNNPQSLTAYGLRVLGSI